MVPFSKAKLTLPELIHGYMDGMAPEDSDDHPLNPLEHPNPSRAITPDPMSGRDGVSLLDGIRGRSPGPFKIHWDPL